MSWLFIVGMVGLWCVLDLVVFVGLGCCWWSGLL